MTGEKISPIWKEQSVCRHSSDRRLLYYSGAGAGNMVIPHKENFLCFLEDTMWVKRGKGVKAVVPSLFKSQFPVHVVNCLDNSGKPNGWFWKASLKFSSTFHMTETVLGRILNVKKDTRNKMNLCQITWIQVSHLMLYKICLHIERCFYELNVTGIVGNFNYNWK